MTAADRPGGLTAMAVINAVLSCLYAIASLASLMTLLVVHPQPGDAPGAHPAGTVTVTPAAGTSTTDPDGPGADSVQADAPHPHHFRHHGPVSRTEQALGLVKCVLCAVLLAISAVGYLRLQRLNGRYVGSLYALVAMLFFVAEHHLSHQPLAITGLIALIYPVLTLVYVNTTFRGDLVQ